MDRLESAIRDYLAAYGDCGRDKPQRATEDEIRDLESYAGGRFPSPYRCFLGYLGGYAGEMLRGTTHGLRERPRLRLREWAEQIVAESPTSFVLPPTAFVFFMTQGYGFGYFDRADGDDPSVWTFCEGDAAPRQIDASLSNYLLRCIDAYVTRARARQAAAPA